MEDERDATAGVHHVTAVASDPQRNLEFYLGVLGLRLVKRTVNFDDPGTHHFYYGDRQGRPGGVITFFPWVGAETGRVGRGQTVRVTLEIPSGSGEFWRARLRRRGVEVQVPPEGPDQGRIEFRDPDGLPLALEPAGSRPGGTAGEEAAVAPEHAVCGIHGVTLAPLGDGRTEELLREVLGFRPGGDGEGRAVRRLVAPGGGGGPGRHVQVVSGEDRPRGRGGTGTVHHVAWRARDEEEQGAWREALTAAGLRVTPVIDRHYFRSTYFREPGGILFEIATDEPGFTADEPVDALGTALRLPPWLEERREEIEEELPPVSIPGGAG